MKKLLYFYFVVAICATLELGYSVVMSEPIHWVSVCVLVAMLGSIMSLKKTKTLPAA